MSFLKSDILFGILYHEKSRNEWWLALYPLEVMYMDTSFKSTKEKSHECLSSFNANDKLRNVSACYCKPKIMQKPLCKFGDQRAVFDID